MKLIRSLLSSGSADLSRQFQRLHVIQTFSTSPFMGKDDKQNLNSSEFVDNFEQRIFGKDDKQNLNSSEFVDNFEQRIFGQGNDPSLSPLYKKLDNAEKAHGLYGMGSRLNIWNTPKYMKGQYGAYNALDGETDYKFKQPPTYFEFDPNEVNKEDYTFRPDVNFNSGKTYDTKDLDLRKPGVRRPARRNEFETTSVEVLRSADFRNVRFLANFITEAGIIIKRSKTGISAKAQRKVAREIKTARAFGLMPFTTMGTKHFNYGKTMEAGDIDFQYETTEHNFVDNERGDPSET